MEKVWNQLGLSRERERLLTLPSARTIIEAVMGFKEKPKLKACILVLSSSLIGEESCQRR
jgi:hypothetical protein